MTLKYLHFAVKPRVCDVCGRRFILEPYETEEVGVVKPVVCTRCMAQAQEKEGDE